MLQQDYDDVADSDDGVDSDDGSSFHSEGEELAEYWDPYCECAQCVAVHSVAVIVHQSAARQGPTS